MLEFLVPLLLGLGDSIFGADPFEEFNTSRQKFTQQLMDQLTKTNQASKREAESKLKVNTKGQISQIQNALRREGISEGSTFGQESIQKGVLNQGTLFNQEMARLATEFEQGMLSIMQQNAPIFRDRSSAGADLIASSLPDLIESLFGGEGGSSFNFGGEDAFNLDFSNPLRSPLSNNNNSGFQLSTPGSNNNRGFQFQIPGVN